MSKYRFIYRNPTDKNYFVVDANFLANKFIDLKFVPEEPAKQKQRIRDCQKWWVEIEKMVNTNQARVYIPDICIAEAVRVLAKKYYREGWFKKYDLYKARGDLYKLIRMTHKQLRRANRKVKYHDISTNRDIIVSVDRYFELTEIKKLSTTIPDIMVLAVAKYIMDFYDIPKEKLFIITSDADLIKLTKYTSELPSPHDPTIHTADKVFKDSSPIINTKI
jgi:predicted nucleic acid-binding protein